ncbi:MAG: hypothetical protein ACW9W4_08005 [Candidatus Nitrosopumilus sp. bin_7KS]
MLEYNIVIVAVLAIILIVAIISTVNNHRKKTSSNQETCVSCRGMVLFLHIQVNQFLHANAVMEQDMWIKNEN